MPVARARTDVQLRQARGLLAAGRAAEAARLCQQILAVMPRNAGALDGMGVAALLVGDPVAALTWLDRALAVKGESAFHVHRAHALLTLGRAADAIAAAREAVRRERTNAEAQQVLGHALMDGHDDRGALAAYQAAARLKPDLPDLTNNLGVALHHAGRLEEAEQTLRRAVREAAGDPGPLINLSAVQRDLGALAAAEAALEAALRLAPGDPRALYNRGLLHLLLGRFADGWPGWEQRFRAGAVPFRGLPAPVWRGEPLAGRTLLVHAEQGLGDTIQFCRYLSRIEGGVVFEVPARLARLLSGLAGRARLVARGEDLPPFDLTCPLMSLPAVMGGDIPAAVPYLRAEPELVARWRDRLGAGGFRVGITWQGNSSRREDTGRSIPLTSYQPLATVPGVRLISLQKDAGSEQLAAGMTIESLGDAFDSGPDGFIDSAAVMMNLDLVITSDTAAAHLAGALGVPVWVALRAVPDWRWLLDRDDSPWYPGMRLFRQRSRGDWAPVFAAMKTALETRDG